MDMYWTRLPSMAAGCSQLSEFVVYSSLHQTRPSSRDDTTFQTTPLTIESTERALQTVQMLQQLGNALTQIHRIRSIKLTLRNTPHKLGVIYSSLSTPCAPLLKSLSVKLGDILINRFTFPPDALSDAPCLRSVEFRFLKFSWKSAVFRHGNLTSLRLENDFVDDTSTTGEMMDALQHLPNLRILELSSIVPSHVTSNGREKVVELKFLEQLVLLDADAPRCIFILRHIQYPSYAVVRLQFGDMRMGIEDSITIISLLGQNLRCTQRSETGGPHRSVVIRSVRLTFDGERTIGITFFNTIDDIGRLHIPFGDSDPIIQIHFYGSPSSYAYLLTSIYNSFDLSSLECLVTNWRFTAHYLHTIQDTLGKLPKLKTIRVSQHPLIICCALMKSNDNPRLRGAESQSSPPVACFPAVKTLQIEDVDFKEYDLMHHLAGVLAIRAIPKIDMPIERLIFKKCVGVKTRYKRMLGQYVVNLEVNGRVVDVEGLGDPGDEDEDAEEDSSDEDEDEEGDGDEDEDEDESESSGGSNSSDDE